MIGVRFCAQKRKICDMFYQSIVTGLVNGQIRAITSFSKYGRPRLAYTIIEESESSASSGSPVILLHGMFGSKSNWKSIGKALNKRTGRKIITFDARNHGESEHHICMSYESMTFDTLNLLKQLDIKRCVILGHSMGGKTAMCFALTHPEIVDKLIVVDSAPTVSIAAGAAVSCLKAMMKLNSQHIKSYMDANRLLEHEIQDENIRHFILTNLRISNGSARWILNLRIFDKNIESLLGFPDSSTCTYAGRTLFIAGGMSSYISKLEIPKIMRLFPNAMIEYVEGAGHWVHSDQPSDFTKKVCNFLRL